MFPASVSGGGPRSGALHLLEVGANRNQCSTRERCEPYGTRWHARLFSEELNAQPGSRHIPISQQRNRPASFQATDELRPALRIGCEDDVDAEGVTNLDEPVRDAFVGEVLSDCEHSNPDLVCHEPSRFPASKVRKGKNDSLAVRDGNIDVVESNAFDPFAYPLMATRAKPKRFGPVAAVRLVHLVDGCLDIRLGAAGVHDPPHVSCKERSLC